MTTFKVPKMSCGHCTATIEKAIKAADSSARVSCDTTTRLVEVDSNLAVPELTTVIRDAGYEAQPVSAG